jgi:hypothetical protein
MNFWVPILLLLILVEVWWFGAHCIAYLSDIRDSLNKLLDTAPDDKPSGIDA